MFWTLPPYRLEYVCTFGYRTMTSVRVNNKNELLCKGNDRNAAVRKKNRAVIRVMTATDENISGLNRIKHHL